MAKKQNARQRMLADNQVWAAMLAGTFARQSGLKPGNLWEPGITRNILERLGWGWPREAVHQFYRDLWQLEG